jgi:hypothetical protein
MSTTATYDSPSTPRVTLTKGDDGSITAVIEVDGIVPDRTATLEEQGAGISSLSPPTVRVRDMVDRREMGQRLVRLACRATAAAVASTPDDPADERAKGPGGLLMAHLRVTQGVLRALGKLGETV